MYSRSILFLLFFAVAPIGLSGCIGTVIGTATDVVIQTAKVPFKVGGAVVDVVAGDDEDEESED